MARLSVVLIGVLAINFINGAPNARIKDLHNSGHHEPKLNDESYSIVDNDEVFDRKQETQRQKRWYNNFPYNPSYVRPYDTGSELEDNLSYLNEGLPEMEDERQNWGIFFNNTETEYDDDDDGSRPISLTPIVTGDDGGRPAPPVEHGSKQASVDDV